MDSLDKRKRKKRGRKKDVLVFEKEDRRLLNHVPDSTNERGNSDRRGYEASDKSSYEEYIEEKASGIRYVTGFEVSLWTYAAGDARRRCTGKVVDISNTGMLVEVSEEDYKALETVSRIKTSFRVTPGSMPEGYEMHVRQKAEVVRKFAADDGKYRLGISFSKSLHHYAAANKDRYMFTISTLLIAFTVGCIMLMRAESVIYFKFNKTLYLYSIITAIFLLSRYLFGAFYRPKKIDPSFTPGVSILIPCFNEEEWIQRTITSCMNQEYPVDKLEVIVIDDCSTDRSASKIKEIVDKLMEDSFKRYGVEGRLRYHLQEKNAGKREALVVGAEMAKHDLVVFVDSDSFLDPFAIINIVQPFKDPKMGGVSGRTDVANTYTNTLTKMQAVRYYVSFRVMKAAEGLFDAVSCLSGPLSCYRKKIILDNKDAWLNQRFLGQKATFGDDRSMTNFILRHHRATYQDTAVCQTIVPNNHKIFLRQQMRWKRSWLRESLIAATFMWRKEPFAAVTFYMGLIVPIAAPIVVVYNLIYVPFTQHIFPTSFVLGIFLMSLLMSMAQLLLRKSSTWIYGMLFCLYYELVLLWQMPIAWFTFWKSTWGTRMTPNDLKAARRKLKRRLLGNKTHVTAAEFASVLGITEEDVLSQMEGGRLAPYVETVNGQKMITSAALNVFYDDAEPAKRDGTAAQIEEKPAEAVVAAAEISVKEVPAEEKPAVEAAPVAEQAAPVAVAAYAVQREVRPAVKTESVPPAAADVSEIRRLEQKIDALLAKHEEEKTFLLEQIRIKDEMLNRKNDQLEKLIQTISETNVNTTRILDHFTKTDCIGEDHV
ncbi:MAG: glycosyltransferase [Lachnospiraceae bacterium]|nr:glycosyltransferase [Lachnospiraceae bacterium]